MDKIIADTTGKPAQAFGYVLPAHWHLIGRWAGNRRLQVISLRGEGGLLTDPTRVPTEADVADHFGSDYWRAMFREHTGYKLVYALHGYDAAAAYRLSQRKTKSAA